VARDYICHLEKGLQGEGEDEKNVGRGKKSSIASILPQRTAPNDEDTKRELGKDLWNVVREMGGLLNKAQRKEGKKRAKRFSSNIRPRS